MELFTGNVVISGVHAVVCRTKQGRNGELVGTTECIIYNIMSIYCLQLYYLSKMYGLLHL